MSVERAPWYAEGLRFGCTGCGACCRGEGYVWVDGEDAQRLADHLGLTLRELGARRLRLVGNRMALTDGPDGACSFWDGGCRVYAARPTQCRTFPFWRGNLASESAWAETAKTSPGVGRGRLYELDEIERLLRREAATDDGGAPPASRERSHHGTNP